MRGDGHDDNAFAAAHVSRAARAAPAVSAFTEVELTAIDGRSAQWIRFGRVAAERIVGPCTRILSFRPGAIFAFVRWTSNDFGTVHFSIQILRAGTAGTPCQARPFVRPGAETLLRVDGRRWVRKLLDAIDAVEAEGIDACDASPDHWRHIADRLAAGLPFRPYTAARHAAWLRRRAAEG